MKRQLNKSTSKSKAQDYARKANRFVPYISNGEAKSLVRIYRRQRAGLPISNLDESVARGLILEGVLAKDFLQTPEEPTGHVLSVDNDQHDTPTAL